jgi:hypothetical protein
VKIEASTNRVATGSREAGGTYVSRTVVSF